MNLLLRIIGRGDPREDFTALAHLRHKLAEAKAGRYLIKPSDNVSSLAELEQKLEKEIGRLEARRAHSS